MLIAEAARLQVNTSYFPGWTLYVDGAERPIEISDPQGLMEFCLEPGQHGVRLLFTNTPVRLWSTRLSLLALFLLLLTPWLRSIVHPTDAGPRLPAAHAPEIT